jgi:competence ComEA-like helix-hairpin-helix protein
LGPAWWIAYGVLCGLGAAGLLLLLASPRRGKPIELLPAPTQFANGKPVEVLPTATVLLPTLIFPLNINTATLEQLQQLPNIGPTLAQAIINYRDSHGPFTSIDQMRNVAGIGPKTFDGIQSLITVGAP